MQYILTQEEYDNMLPKILVAKRDEALEVARKIIVKLSGIACGTAYCDDCPIANPERYMPKGREESSRDVSLAICHLYRKYSK